MRCDTEIKVLWYCYVHFAHHYYAFKTIIQLHEDFFTDYIFEKSGNILMIDGGCGPMTSCLAIADT
jgi:hypothetical protein